MAVDQYPFVLKTFLQIVRSGVAAIVSQWCVLDNLLCFTAGFTVQMEKLLDRTKPSVLDKYSGEKISERWPLQVLLGKDVTRRDMEAMR